MPPIIIKIPPGDPGPALERAARVLRSGGLVAFPTESFYALGADALNRKAVEKVFKAKGRGMGKPLPVIIHDKAELPRYIKDLSPIAGKAASLLMPGPVTLVFRAAGLFPDNLTAGTGKVAIRVPGHALAVGLSGALGGPVTATSANIAGQPGLTDPGDVAGALGGSVDLILDGGQCPGGPPSSILDVTTDPPSLVREGRVEKSVMERLLGTSIA